MSAIAPIDRGVRLVMHTGDSSYREDLSLPFRVHLVLRPPGFMVVAWVGLHGGSEEIVARGETLEAIESFIARNELEDHPRFSRLTITGPGNLAIERSGRRPKP